MEVIYNIGKLFYAEMQMCVELQSIDKCHDLYERVKNMPSSHTRGVIEKASNIILNGPSADSPHILLGADIIAKKRVVVKLIKGADVPRSMTPQEREETKSAEIEACKFFTALDVDGLVKCEVVEVKIESADQLQVGVGYWQAIKMRDYGICLARYIKFPEDLIEKGFHRILNALQRVHLHKFVHMDVKSANVFVTDDLLWDLGDFGSVRKNGEKVLSWTPLFTPYEMPMSCEVIEEMDMVQLCVMIAVELTKDNWGKQLCREESGGEGAHVQEHRVLEALMSIKSQSFRDEITQLFQKSMIVVKNHVIRAKDNT